MVTPARSRLAYAGLMVVVFLLGLGSRAYGDHLPRFVATYAGDTLWALLVFLGLGFLFPQRQPLHLAGAALLFSYLIELSQLYHAPWIDGIRATRPGGLVLGYGFLWSDLLCYTAGVALGLAGELLWGRRTARMARGLPVLLLTTFLTSCAFLNGCASDCARSCAEPGKSEGEASSAGAARTASGSQVTPSPDVHPPSDPTTELLSAFVASQTEVAELQQYLETTARGLAGRLRPQLSSEEASPPSPRELEQAFIRQVISNLRAKRQLEPVEGKGFSLAADEVRRTVIDYEAFKLETYVSAGVFPKRYFGYLDLKWDTADLERRLSTLVHAAVAFANEFQAARGHPVRLTDREVLVTWIAEGGALLLGEDQDLSRSPQPALHPVLAVGLDSITDGFSQQAGLVRRLDEKFGTGLSEVVSRADEGGARAPALTRYISFDETILATVAMYLYEKELCAKKLEKAGRPPLEARALDEQFILASLVYNSGLLFSEERVAMIRTFGTGAYLYGISEANAEKRWRLNLLEPPALLLDLLRTGTYREQPTSWNAVYHVLQRYGGYVGLTRFTDWFDGQGAWRI